MSAEDKQQRVREESARQAREGARLINAEIDKFYEIMDSPKPTLWQKIRAAWELLRG